MIKYAKVKRILSGLLSILLLSLFFISINGIGAESKTTLSVLLGDWWKDQVPIIKEKYEQTHPDVELTMRLMGFKGMREKLISQLIAHKLADVSTLGNVKYVPGLVDKGLIAPWDKYIGPDKPIKPEWFAPNMLETFYLQGHYWAIPYRGGSNVLLCNRNIFKEAGFNPDVYPTNLKEVKKYARFLTNPEKGIYGFVFEAANPSQWYELIQQVLWNFGADVVNKEGTEATINSPSAVEAIDFIASFIREGLSPKASLGFTVRQSRRYFGLRKAAMVLSEEGGQFAIDEVWPDLNWSKDIGPAVMEHPVIHPNPLGWQRNPNHPEESVKFVAWFIENLPELTIRIPCTVRLGDWINKPRYAPWLRQMGATKETMNLIPQFSEVSHVVGKHVQRVCLGEATAKEAMEIAAEEINKILSGK